MEKCTKESFPTIHEEEAFEDYKIFDALCVKDSEAFAVAGKSKTENYKQVVFTLVKNKRSDKFWDKTTVSVIGQENIVNFN